MSYVLHVWASRALASLDEVVAAHAALSRQRGLPQDPRFIEFARRLTQRFPCMTTQAEEGNDEAVWSDGPIDGKTDAAVYGVGVLTEHLTNVVPFVAATATSLGLVMFDQQAGEAHLPDGRVLTRAGCPPVRWEVAPQEDSDLLEKKQDAVEVLNEVFTPLLEPQGFKSLKRWSDTYAPYKRRFKECDQYLFFDIGDGVRSYLVRAIFDIQPKFSGAFKALPDTTCHVDFGAVSERLGVPPVPGADGGRGREPAFARASELRRWAQQVADIVIRGVVPLADRCSTLAGLDAALHPPDTAEPSMFKRYPWSLYVARAAGNAHLAEWIAYWRANVPTHWRKDAVDEIVAKITSLS